MGMSKTNYLKKKSLGVWASARVEGYDRGKLGIVRGIGITSGGKETHGVLWERVE